MEDSNVLYKYFTELAEKRKTRDKIQNEIKSLEHKRDLMILAKKIERLSKLITNINECLVKIESTRVSASLKLQDRSLPEEDFIQLSRSCHKDLINLISSKNKLEEIFKNHKFDNDNNDLKHVVKECQKVDRHWHKQVSEDLNALIASQGILENIVHLKRIEKAEKTSTDSQTDDDLGAFPLDLSNNIEDESVFLIDNTLSSPPVLSSTANLE